MFDLEDSSDFNLTPLDKERLAELDVGEEMDTENGFMRICRYENEYVLIISSMQKNDMKEFKTAKQLVYYIEEILE
jgi:hypothetical protein